MRPRTRAATRWRPIYKDRDGWLNRSEESPLEETIRERMADQIQCRRIVRECPRGLTRTMRKMNSRTSFDVGLLPACVVALEMPPRATHRWSLLRRPMALPDRSTSLALSRLPPQAPLARRPAVLQTLSASLERRLFAATLAVTPTATCKHPLKNVEI
jgi:hypothetical protein